MSKRSLTGGLLTWADDNLYSLLTRPQMYAISSEALWGMVMENMRLKWLVTGYTPTRQDHLKIFQTIGAMGESGPNITFPERITDEFVEKLGKAAAEFAAYDPGDRPERDEAWSEHWRTCPECHTSMSSKQDAYVEGRRIWAAKVTQIDDLDQALWKLAGEAETLHAVLTDMGVPTEGTLTDRVAKLREIPQ